MLFSKATERKHYLFIFKLETDAKVRSMERRLEVRGAGKGKG